MSHDLTASLAALDAAFMPDTATITHTTPGAVNDDGSREPGTITTTTVACRLVAGPQAAETLDAMRLVAEADAVLYVPLDTAVDVRDTATVGGITYHIAGSNAGASYATSRMLAIKSVQ
jgi:hypothetical protein